MKIRLAAMIAVLAAGAAFAAPDLIKINTTEENGRLVDDINLPFADDPAVIGEWRSVDFVMDPAAFTPGAKKFRGELYLGGFKFFAGGKMAVLPNAPDSAPWFNWTKGIVTHNGDRTASRYTLKRLKGETYMFFEWKSGDYSLRHQKPRYYVLKKVK
jgi:bla regulator protein BlaR1